MFHAVIEITGSDVQGVSLWDTYEEAEEHAVGLATENTSYSEPEIRENLHNVGYHAEGDYAVHISKASKGS